MKLLFEKAGRAALVAFIAAVLPLAIGVLAAPDLNQAMLLATAALIAGVAAVIKAVQVFVPQLVIGGAYGPILTAVARAALSSFLVLVVGVYSAPDLSTAKAALTALIIGVVTAVLRTLIAAFTPGENPAPAKGLNLGPQPI